MTTDLRSDPELARLVERARVAAIEAGEILTGPTAIDSSLGEEVGGIVAAWIADGGYEQAIAEVEAGDPDLRTE